MDTNTEPIVSFEAVVHRAKACDGHDAHDAECEDCRLTLTPCDDHAQPDSGQPHHFHFDHGCEACNLKAKAQEFLGIIAHSHPHLIPAGALRADYIGHAELAHDEGGEG